MRNTVVLFIAVIVASLAFMGCEPTKSNKPADKQEQEKQAQNYEGLTKTQEARGMSYSPTRDTSNHWAETWEEQGKLSYVYLLDSVGHKIGYYIFEGLPVSYCASLTPPDKVEKVETYGSPNPAVVRAAPSLDGMYYGSCNSTQYYGYDAVSGAYLEFTGGGSFNYLLSDQPMTEIDTEPLGDATIEKVEKQK